MHRRTLLGTLAGLAAAAASSSETDADNINAGEQAPAVIQVAGISGRQDPAVRPPDVPDAPSVTAEPRWSRIHVDDPYLRDALRRVLDAAAELLTKPQCEAVTSDFVDMQGQKLATKLTTLGITAGDYLRLVVFNDGGGQAACKRDGILAYTAAGSRVVYVCGRTFVRAAQREPEEARTLVIHELLHSLGLGENPPTSKEITYRVKRRCWP